MQIKSKNVCPLLKKECVGLDCAWFIQLRGVHPQTGNAIDEWGCSVAWLPILLIENAKETRQGAAAIESFRNEVVRATIRNLPKPKHDLVTLDYKQVEQIIDND